jgi:group I intron endonuclease
VYYIYSHTNKTNGKKYIGITNSIENRFRNNGIAYKPYNGKISARPFWNAICKYGFDAFEHEIIDTVDTFERACELEKHYILLLDTTNMKKGYNISPGGNGGKIYSIHPRGMKGKHHSQEKTENQSRLMKELHNEGKMAWKNGHPKGMLGKSHTEEHKKHISNVMNGRIISEETKIKMANSRRGKTHSEETKTKLSNINKGLHEGANNSQARTVAYSLNGETKEFGCLKDLLKCLNISKTIFYKLVKTKEGYTPNGMAKNRHKHLKGMKIFYLE